MADVFISYSRKDRAFVLKLHDALARLNRDTWVDWHDIPLTADFLREIYAGIEGADNFIFVISPESVGSATCQKEIAHAAINNKRLLPIFHRDVPDEKVPTALARINWIFFRDTDDFESTFASLIDALDTDLEWKRTHTRLLVRAVEWATKGRDDSFLLRGMDLQDGLQWLAQSPTIKKQEPSELHREYIKASQKWEAGEIQRLQELNEQVRRRARRLRQLSAALGVTLLVVLGAALFAFWQEATARSRQLVATSILTESADPELSVLIAAEGVAATWPAGHIVLPEAEQQLHHAVMASHLRLTLSGHTNVVASVTWSPDGKRLATGSADSTAKTWDAQTGKELLTFNVWDAQTSKDLVSGHDNVVKAVAWSPDGKQLATGSFDNVARVWDAATGKELLSLPARSGPVAGLAWSPDGKRLATGSGDTKLWDAETGKELLRLSSRSVFSSAVAWRPDGKRLATTSDDDTARIWDAQTGKELLSLSGHRRFSSGVAWSPDGKRLAMGSQDNTAEVCDSETGKELLTVSGHQGAVSSVAWSPDGKRLATGSWDQTAKIWEAGTGKELLSFSGQSGPVSDVAWSPEGKRLATGSLIARVWDTATGKELLTLPSDAGLGSAAAIMFDAPTGKLPWPVAWSPDGKRLATSCDSAKVWDAATGKEVLVLGGFAMSVGSMAWSPDGKRLATGISEAASVWNSETGKRVLTLKGRAEDTGSVVVAWSPDGKRLAMGSADETVKVWDAQTGKELLILSGNSGPVYSVAWSPDGKRLASESSDGAVQIYAMDIRDLIALARERVAAHPSKEGCKKSLNVDQCPTFPELRWW